MGIIPSISGAHVMGITFAPTGVILGVLAGLLVAVASGSTALGVVVGIVASVAAWYAILGIEKVIDRGVEAGFAAVTKRVGGSHTNESDQ